MAIYGPFPCPRFSLVAQLVKNLPAMWETWVQSLGWEDPLEKGKATHSSILAWRIPWTISKSHSSSKFQSHFWTSLVAQTVKHLPTKWETWVRSLGREDSLEKEMATHSSILAWNIPWMEEPGRLRSMGLQRVRHNWATSPYLTSPWMHIKFNQWTSTYLNL